MYEKHSEKTKAKARSLYLSGKTRREIEIQLGTGQGAVYHWLKKAGILRTISEAQRLRVHAKLSPDKLVTKDESKMHKKSMCPQCHKEFYARKRYSKKKGFRWQRFCSITCHNKHGNKGYISADGYKLLSALGKKPKYRSRKVMEDKIGRLLKRSERVHHIDFDKLNDSLSNLCLCNQREHRKADCSLFDLVKPLMDRKIIKFKKGRYILVCPTSPSL